MSDNTRYALTWLANVTPPESGLEFFDTRQEMNAFRHKLDDMFGAEVEYLPFAVSPVGSPDHEGATS